jgi:plasmid stabilization system protein ParE
MKLTFLEAAQSEFDETITYYEEQRSELGFEFADAVEEALGRIEQYPEAWSPLSPRVRRCLVNRFPYGVIYEVRDERVIVVAFQNLLRKPDSWRSRVK